MRLPSLRIPLAVWLFTGSLIFVECRQPAASVDEVASINGLKPDQPLNIDPKLRRALLRVLNRLERDEKVVSSPDSVDREVESDDKFFRLYSEPVKTEDLGSINSKELEPTVPSSGSSSTAPNSGQLYTTQDFSYIPPSDTPQQDEGQKNVQDFNFLQPSSAPEQETVYQSFSTSDTAQQEPTTSNLGNQSPSTSESTNQPSQTNSPEAQFPSSSGSEDGDAEQFKAPAVNHDVNYIPPTEEEATSQMTQPTPENKDSLSFDTPTPIDIPDVIPQSPQKDEMEVEAETEGKPSSSMAPIVVQSEETMTKADQEANKENTGPTKTTVESTREPTESNSTSASVLKSATLSDEKNVKHEVEFLPSSLIVAFTLQQDDRGNPKRVIPLEFAHNQPELVQKRQRELEEKERILQLELRTLQEEKFRVQDVLHNRNTPVPQTTVAQSSTPLLDVTHHEYERARLLQEQQRLRDELRRQEEQVEQRRLQELERRRQQEIEQQRFREFEQQRLRDIEHRRQQEFLKEQEYLRQQVHQRHRGAFNNNFHPFSPVAHGDTFAAVKNVDNHLLPPNQPFVQGIDFQKSIDYRVPPTHLQVPYQQLQRSNVHTQISQSVELNRVNRHEPPQFIANQGFQPNEAPIQNSLQSLLTQSGLAGRFLPAESKDDLNIVSKLLSYNNLPGTDFQSPSPPPRNVLPPQF